MTKQQVCAEQENGGGSGSTDDDNFDMALVSSGDGLLFMYAEGMYT